ncbi:hypothetical protein DF152_35525, partial [Burkholderia cenocepacia]
MRRDPRVRASFVLFVWKVIPMKAAALIALTCLALTACGGDDNPSPASSGGSGTSNNGGSGG